MRYVDLEHHLQIEIDSKECQIPESTRLRMQPNLERLASAMCDFPISQLWITVVYHPESDVYHSQAKLKLPGQTIITGDRNAALEIALLRCLDKVIHRVEAYRTNPDQEAVTQAARTVELQDGVIAPVAADGGKLGKAFVDGDYRAFRQELFSHEEPVRLRVGRWIQRYPEIQERIGDTLEIADLVEDVFLTAFEKYSERPEEVSISDWLESLIDPAIRSFSHNPDDRRAASFARSYGE